MGPQASPIPGRWRGPPARAELAAGFVCRRIRRGSRRLLRFAGRCPHDRSRGKRRSGAPRRCARPTQTPSRPPRPPDRPVLAARGEPRGARDRARHRPFGSGPLTVTALAESLPAVRFPVDLSGGVARFRHKRGALDAARRRGERGGPRRVGRAASPRALRRDDAGSRRRASRRRRAGRRVLGGSARWPSRSPSFPPRATLCFIPERARGIGLAAPAQVLALRALAVVDRP